jgi:signal transduction histidine kinase
MSRRLGGIRVQLALLFVTGFALLLAAGAAGLYAWLERSYRAEFDRDLVASGRSASLLFELERPEYPSLEAGVAHVVGELIFGDRTLVAFDSLGRRFAVSRRLPGAPILDDLVPSATARGPYTAELRDGAVRVLRVQLGPDAELYVGRSLEPLSERLARLRLSLLLGLPLILLVGGVAGAWGARAFLRPVVDVARRAEQIGAEVSRGATTFERLPEQGGEDEIGALTTAFNCLVDELSEALRRERAAADRQRAFLGDAAHELRTPVAIVRSQAESALAGPADPAEYRGALEAIADESRRMSALVGDLLLLARGHAVDAASRGERVYLDDIAGQVMARLRGLPAAQGRVIRAGEFEAAPTRADPALLERAVGVLVHNALVHAAPSPVEVSTGVERRDGALCAWVAVRDWGAGVPAGAEERIFERLGRLNTGVDGAGLGLPIARWVAEQYGGTVVLDRAVDCGARFVLRLPADSG